MRLLYCRSARRLYRVLYNSVSIATTLFRDTVRHYITASLDNPVKELGLMEIVVIVFPNRKSCCDSISIKYANTENKHSYNAQTFEICSIKLKK